MKALSRGSAISPRNNTCQNGWAISRAKSSFRFQIHRFNNRPPLLDLLRLVRGKCTRGLLIACRSFLPQIGEPTAYGLVSQSIDHGPVKLRDDLLRRAPG